MKVLICSDPDCATFEWRNPDEELCLRGACIFCGAFLREVTEEEQKEADEIVGAYPKYADEVIVEVVKRR